METSLTPGNRDLSRLFAQMAVALELSPIGSALPLARLLSEGLAQLEGVGQVAHGVALRRGRERVDRIELVATRTPRSLAWPLR